MLILYFYLFFVDHRISEKCVCIGIYGTHIDSGYLSVVVSRVVVNAFVCIATGGIKSNFIAVVANIAATTLLLYRVHDMKKLTDAFFFCFTGNRVEFCECSSDKT